MKGSDFLERVWNIKELLEFMNRDGKVISDWALRQAVNKKIIPSFRIAGRILFQKSVILAWMSNEMEKSILPQQKLKRTK